MTRTVLLGDIVDTIIDYRGKTPKKLGGNWSVTGYRALSAKNIENGKIKNPESIRYVDEAMYKKWMKEEIDRGDILLTSEAPLGQSLLWDSDEKIVLSQRLFGIRAKKDIVDPNFLYAYISSPVYQAELQARATGSTVKGIRQAELVKTKLHLPELEDQKKIGDFIRAIDEKIELNWRMNETLEQLGQALFRHYFIDNPEAEKWEERSLDEIADFLNGLAMQKYPRIDGEPTLPVIKIREMSSGITANTDIASANIPEQYTVHNGDLLFSWSGTLLVKFWAEGDGALNQHLFKVSSEKYPEWLYYYWIKHHLDDFIQTAKSKATTMGHIQRKHLKQAMVRVPDAAMMQEIGDQMQPLIDAYKENAKQIQTLTTLRDTLLPRLISGKIKV